MFSMRIDIIRKELDRRYCEIQGVGDHASEGNKFLFFLLTTPGIREFIINLAKSKDRFKNSDEYNRIKNEIISSIKEIVEIIRDGGFENGQFIDGLPNHFQLPTPDLKDSRLSFNQYIECLRNFENYFDQVVISVSEPILGSINHIFNVANDNKWRYDKIKYKTVYNILSTSYDRLTAHLGFRFQYEGAESVVNLLSVFFRSHLGYLVDLTPHDFGNEVEKACNRRNENCTMNIFLSSLSIEDYKTLYHAVDKFLMTSKSKSALIARLKTYCILIKRSLFQKERVNEAEISKIVEEFIFNYGYFPVVNPKMGSSIPDILVEPSINIRWDNSVLIELKQYINNNCTIGKLNKAIAQSKNYLSIVRGLKPEIDDMVYLLIFYGGDYLLDIDDKYRDPKVNIEFIYVGKNPPSKLKGPKTLGE